MRTKIFRKLIITSCLIPILGGCLEKRIVWSPQGDIAAVNSDKGLFFIKPDGKVLPVRFSDALTRVSWFQDGKRLAIAHQQKASTWTEVSPFLTDEQKKRIEELTPGIREQVLKYTGDWEKFELSPAPALSGGMSVALILYVRDQVNTGLAEKMGADQWKKLQEISSTIWTLQIFGFSVDTLKPGNIIATSLDGILQPKVSPDGNKVGFISALWDHADNTKTLFVASMEGSQRIEVSSNVANDFDWSATSDQVAFVHRSGTEKDDTRLQLGALAISRIAGNNGALLQKASDPDDVAGTVYNNELGIHWMKDGRILFASLELTLPVTTKDMPQRWSLFAFDPKMPATVQRVIARSANLQIDGTLPLFAVSPDETKVAMLGDKSRVMLYDFASADLTQLVEIESDNQSASLPSWRGMELCFVSPTGSGDNQSTQVMLWQNGKATSISTDWSGDLRAGWLDDKKN